LPFQERQGSVSKSLVLCEYQFQRKEKGPDGAATIQNHKSELVLIVSNYLWIKEATLRGEALSKCLPEFFGVSFKMASTTFKGLKTDDRRFFFDYHGANFWVKDFLSCITNSVFASYMNDVVDRYNVDNVRQSGAGGERLKPSSDLFHDDDDPTPLSGGDNEGEDEEDDEEEVMALRKSPSKTKKI